MITHHTPRDVIAALGGASKVAKRLGIGRTAVSNWALGESFPPKTYLALKAALKDVGADAPDSLWPMLTFPAEKLSA